MHIPWSIVIPVVLEKRMIHSQKNRIIINQPWIVSLYTTIAHSEWVFRQDELWIHLPASTVPSWGRNNPAA